MKIKCSKEWNILIVISIVLVVACGCLMYVKFNSIVPSLLAVLISLLLIFRYWIVFGRTIIMDKDGCTISFWGISKKYKWDELKTKRIENYSHRLRTRHQPYTKGAIFSPKHVRNPLKLMPIEYSVFHLVPSIRFFGYIFVFFDPHFAGPAVQPDIYEVEEAEFRKCMAEWNVDIEDTTRR